MSATLAMPFTNSLHSAYMKQPGKYQAWGDDLHKILLLLWVISSARQYLLQPKPILNQDWISAKESRLDRTRIFSFFVWLCLMIVVISICAEHTVFGSTGSGLITGMLLLVIHKGLSPSIKGLYTDEWAVKGNNQRSIILRLFVHGAISAVCLVVAVAFRRSCKGTVGSNAARHS